MPLIPKEIYSLVERKRRCRWVAEKRAMLKLQDAQAAAFSLGSPGAGGSGGRSGPGDRVGKLALAVAEAQEKLDNARAWEEIWRMMDRLFPFDRTQEGRVAGFLYDNGMTDKEIANVCRCSTSAVYRARDNWVCHAALFAAGEGLIQIRERGK